MIGKQCYYIDRVTHSKKFEGKPLGKCIGEGLHSVNNFHILWFSSPFLGFKYQYKKDVRL